MRNGGNGRNGHAGNGGAPGVVRCAIYCRKSTSEGLDRNFTSLDNQRESAEAFIRSQQHEGWITLPDRFDDGGFTGANTERPALKRLLADVDAGKIDCILTYKLDRISRNLRDFLNLNEVFERRGVTVVSVTEPINTKTPMGRAFMSVLLSFGQMEREVCAERTRDKVHAARRRGQFVGGGLILGYDRGSQPGQLAVNKAEADRVREIFKLFIANPSLIGLAQDLNGRGWALKRWTTKDGREYGGGGFDKHNLRRMLTNHAYVAEVAFDGNVYPAEHEAIVDREPWDAVQAIMADRSWEPRRSGRSSTALLAGILRCAPCDSAMTPTYSGRNGRRYRYYLCQRAHRQGWASCPSKSVPATEVEQFVVDRIRAIGRDPDLIAATTEQARQALAARRSELEVEIREVLKAIDAAHAAARAQITAAGGRRSRRRGDDGTAVDVPALEEHLAALRAELDGLKDLRIDPAELRAALSTFEPVWEQMTSVERQRVVRLLIEQIDYDGSTAKLGVSFSAAGVRTLATESVVEGAGA